MGMGSRPNTMMPQYGGFPQSGSGQQFGTYDPILGFGQASGMGTTYNAPTRYTADYTRFLQSGQPFNPAVMGYNSYGQIFAQPQRPPPPTMGVKGGFKPPSQRGSGKGGGYRPSPPPTMGGKGGQQVGSPGVPSTGFDPEGYFRNRPVRGPRGDQGSRDTYGGFLDFYNRQTNPANSIFETGPAGQTAVGPSAPAANQGMSEYDTAVEGFVKSVMGANPNMTEERARQLAAGRYENLSKQSPAATVGPQRPTDVEYPFDQNIANSPFGQLIGQPAAQPAMAQQGAIISNPDRDRAQEIMMRSYNNPSSITSEDMAFLQEYDARPRDAERLLAAQRQMAAGNTFGLGGMPSGTQVTNPNQFAISTADLRFDPTTGTYGPSVTRYFENPSPSQPFNFGQNFGRMAFQEGGQVPPDAASNMDKMLSEAAPANPQSEMAGEYDRLIQMTMQAILGQVESPDEVIQMFIDEFGVDAFRQLRDAVLKQQVPGAQTEGMVNGNGGGMDDQVMGMIGNQRPVAVSPGEYIVPADVVSGLGDGSSKSGADILDELNQAVRMARTGTTEQPRPLAESMR